MKGSSFARCAVFSSLLLLLTLVTEAASRGYVQTYNGRNSFYRDAENSSPYVHYTQKVPLNNAKSYGLPRDTYQRYITCEPRTFSFQGCTLCFCTDRHNVGLCWDYDARRCSQTRRFVDQQRNLRNNDPQGVW